MTLRYGELTVLDAELGIPAGTRRRNDVILTSM